MKKRITKDTSARGITRRELVGGAVAANYAIHYVAGTLTVTDSTFDHNLARWSNGGAINSNDDLDLVNSTLAYNTAGELSLDELAKNSGVSKNTLRRYIEYLEAEIERLEQAAEPLPESSTVRVRNAQRPVRERNGAAAHDSVFAEVAEPPQPAWWGKTIAKRSSNAPARSAVLISSKPGPTWTTPVSWMMAAAWASAGRASSMSTAWPSEPVF